MTLSTQGTVIVPLVTFTVAYLFFDFKGAHYASFIAMFATPVSVSSAPMAQEMGGDVNLAGQVVVWSTVVSAFTVFITTFLLRLGGVL
jgi:predicted permease